MDEGVIIHIDGESRRMSLYDFHGFDNRMQTSENISLIGLKIYSI